MAPQTHDIPEAGCSGLGIKANMDDIVIRPVSADSDSATIADIYNYYIRETVITFEEQEVTKEQIVERINSVVNTSMPWLVAEVSGRVLGYCYASRYHARSAYRFTVEATIYLQRDVNGYGIGSRLFESLITELKNGSCHSVIGVIALPNEASVKLHEKFNFKKVGHFREVGFKFGRWHDVGYWQILLNA